MILKKQDKIWNPWWDRIHKSSPTILSQQIELHKSLLNKLRLTSLTSQLDLLNHLFFLKSMKTVWSLRKRPSNWTLSASNSFSTTTADSMMIADLVMISSKTSKNVDAANIFYSENANLDWDASNLIIAPALTNSKRLSKKLSLSNLILCWEDEILIRSHSSSSIFRDKN